MLLPSVDSLSKGKQFWAKGSQNHSMPSSLIPKSIPSLLSRAVK